MYLTYFSPLGQARRFLSLAEKLFQLQPMRLCSHPAPPGDAGLARFQKHRSAGRPRQRPHGKALIRAFRRVGPAQGTQDPAVEDFLLGWWEFSGASALDSVSKFTLGVTLQPIHGGRSLLPHWA